MECSRRREVSNVLNVAFEENKRPKDFFLASADLSDDPTDFKQLELLEALEINLSRVDMELWNGWDILTPEAKAYFFPGIVASTFSGDFGMFMMVDKLLCEIGGFDEKSENNRLWDDCFWTFWAAGFSMVSELAKDWVEFLDRTNSESGDFLPIFSFSIKLKKAKAILLELNSGNIDPIIVL